MATVSVREQIGLLSGLNEGDVFEVGAPFKFAQKEKLVWKCEEVTRDYGSDLPAPPTRYTFHVYYMGVMLRAFTVFLDHEKETLDWGNA